MLAFVSSTFGIVALIIALIWFRKSISKTANTAEQVLASANLSTTRELTILQMQHEQSAKERLEALGFDTATLKKKNDLIIDWTDLFNNIHQ